MEGMTAEASNKVTRFVDSRNFSSPVHLVDNPGFVIGLEAESSNYWHGARL